jgi:hypothetical protein
LKKENIFGVWNTLPQLGADVCNGGILDFDVAFFVAAEKLRIPAESSGQRKMLRAKL